MELDDVATVEVDLEERLRHMNKIDALLERERQKLDQKNFTATREAGANGEVSVTVSGNGVVREVKVSATVPNKDIGPLVLDAAQDAQVSARTAAEKSFALIAQRVINADPVKLLAER
jgi:DNA-binding protein YbaB